MMKSTALLALLLVSTQLHANSALLEAAQALGITTHTQPQKTAPIHTCKLRGKVVKVVDSDTVILLKNKQQYTIRLSGIDAPERNQPFGTVSKRYLAHKIAGKTVCVDGEKRDKYNRLIGKLHLNNKDINLQLIKAGFAWHYKHFSTEQSASDRVLYAKADAKARKKRIGLWAEPTYIAPWDWRRGVRPQSKQQRDAAVTERRKQAAQQPRSKFSCNSGKRYCKHMNSCAEARFHLTQCGLKRLDRDKDGIPCESICGG